ncbi:hypothetical protein N7523_005727 [Penicillium sp. IBT 18751x]|nr:hypothetical protein N7523_005727 [Penicillium sp. IBT 18751x]
MKARCNGQGPPGRECTASEIERALATDDGEHQQSDLLPPMSNRAALLKPGQISSLGERAEDVQKRRSLEKLPSWDIIDQLKEQYFESVFSLFCIFSSIQFADDFKAFRQNPDAASLSWIALLFAILALACQARERSERDDLLDRRLSVTYENAAWGCLFINDAPYNSSTNALQAVILILYGRVHRGENVTKNLQTAYDMASFISCHQCPAQALACEEHGMIWAGLKMLLSLNSQVHNDCVDEEVSRSLHLRAGVDHKKLAEIQIRYLKLEVSSLPETTFTMLQLHILGISDTIAISIKQGLLSESSLPGVVDELSRMEKYCQELGTRLKDWKRFAQETGPEKLSTIVKEQRKVVLPFFLKLKKLLRNEKHSSRDSPD